MDDAIQLNMASLDRHQVNLERHYAANLPQPTIDRHKVLQILVDLISNAKWAVSAGEGAEKVIRIGIDATPENTIRISVTDTGIGIAADDLGRIFEHGFSRRKGGHGFGLHSASNAAHAMGGTLRATSSGPNTGATFRLELPLARPVAMAA